MAPSRRRGANKDKAKSQLSLGDLVLAKVKGFPFWPAKISRPEDWKKSPDLKKYFVQFFGTKEIAFVAPVDIQAFTVEAKNKLSVKSQGKTKYFAQAVKEICEAFDELQKKKAGELRDDTDRSDVGCEALSADGVEDNEAEIDLKDAVTSSGEAMNEEIVVSGSKLERCSHRLGDNESQDVKPSIACSTSDNLSPALSFHRSKVLDVTQRKKEVLLKSASSDFSYRDNNGASSDGHKSKKMVTVSGRKTKATVEGKSSSSVLTLLKNDNGCAVTLESGDQIKDGIKGKGVSISDGLNLDSENGGEKNGKDILKMKKHPKAPDSVVDPKEPTECKLSGRSKKAQGGVARPNAGKNENFPPAKKSKLRDAGGEVNREPLPRCMKGVSPSSVGNKAVKKSELRRLASRVKEENYVTPKSQKNVSVGSKHISVDEAVLPLTKHQCQVLQEISDRTTTVSDIKMEKDSFTSKKEAASSSSGRVVSSQLHKKRRAVCLHDDDEDGEAPKTPIHGVSATYLKLEARVSDDNKRSVVDNESIAKAESNMKGSTEILDTEIKTSLHLPNGRLSSCNPLIDNNNRPESQHCSSGKMREIQPQIDESRNEIQPHTCKKNENTVKVNESPGKSEFEQLLREARSVSLSPIKSPRLLCASKLAVEQHKTLKSSVKTSPVGGQKKAQALSSKAPGVVSCSQNQLTVQKIKMASAGEKAKATPKSVSHTNEVALSGERLIEPSEMIEACKEEKSGLLTGSRTPESPFSIKHLIAAAQAKRRQAQIHNFPFGVSSTTFASITDVQGTSPSPSAVQRVSSGGSNIVLADIQGSNNGTGLGSPSTLVRQSTAQDQLDNEAVKDQRVSSGHRTVGGSLSGGTEAAVARDAFEGMIETLSRTKESIGRATRLAIDCAKYGIANEVIELLIRKLESEPSYHRKVDLFFLVDSITQCSHNQKGIAGASYIPTVQAALPRLLGAAVPAGSGARENRRQCLKVLRLWLERKILPEPLIRPYMDDIGVPNEDTTADFSLRRPSRTERAFDDPIREMEGMLVDEYGSNATFQLPGFLSSNVFDEEEEEEALQSNSCKENGHPTQFKSKPSFDDSEFCEETPNDRRHCILEDVDGELEMEDVSGHPKDERSLSVSASYEMNLHQQVPDGIMEPTTNISDDLPPLPEGSPPLPPESPPPPPPLPSSPAPLPPLSSPPPLPPPPLSELSPSLPLSCPPFLISQSSMPTQPLLLPQLPSQSSGHSSSQMVYQTPVSREYCSTASGNQRIGSTLHQAPLEIVNSEMFQQQPPCFMLSGGCGSREASAFNSRQVENGQNEIYLNQVPQPSQQFFQGNAPVQIPLQHHAPPQHPSSHFLYAKPAVPQHPYQHQYPLPSVPDGRRQFVPDEQWRIPSNEFKIDNQQSMRINGGRTPAGPLFCQEGYFRPPFERPPTNNMGFQHSAPNVVGTGPPISGHTVPQMLPSRPDISALNCWRPA